MVQYSSTSDHLSATYAALADPTRRAMLTRLGQREMTVAELAKPFKMSAPAISKHLKVLEKAGLITREKEAQWRRCRIEAARLKEANEFIEGWNQQTQTSQLATASQQHSKSPLEAFPLDPQQVPIFLGGVAGGIAVDVVKDTLKEFISDLLKRKRNQRAPKLRVEAVRQPGGAMLLVVHEEEK